MQLNLAGTAFIRANKKTQLENTDKTHPIIIFIIQSENKRGACTYSPDAVRQGIECVSCLACAKCLLYHCHYEDENFS